jgi:hypothetical protein
LPDATQNIPPNHPTFRGFLDNLEPWECQLLKHLRHQVSPSLIMTAINAESTTYISSDGSVIDQKYGSFGYTITIPTTRARLVKGAGPVPGTRMSSFRAEAYGVLAVLRFLLRLSEYTRTTIQTKVIHWIDNQSVLKRLRRARLASPQSPNETLRPDWDVVHAVKTTLGQLAQVQYEFEWVRSHQDNQQPYHTLPLEAQINCDADTEATQFHSTSQGRIQQVLVPMIPSTKAQLAIQGHTVTAYYKQTIRNRIHLPPYYQYLQQRFSWDETTIRQIDWESFRKLISPYEGNRPTLVKHLHGMAPTGKYAHRNDHHEPAQCPACPCPSEHNDHLFQCPAESREQWRQTTIRKLQHSGNASCTQTELCNILIAGLQCAFRDTCESLPAEQFPPTYSSLIAAQNKIGWPQLFRGRWAKEWSSIASQDAGPLNQDPQLWVKHRGRILLNQWWELWKLRNTERHDLMQETARHRLRSTVESHLAELYNLRDQIMPVDRSIFPFATVQDHINHSSNWDLIIQWCIEQKPAILASQKQAQARGIAQNQNVRTLLQAQGDMFTTQDTANPV